MNIFQKFVGGYVDAMIWADKPEDESWSTLDISVEGWAQIKADCQKFFNAKANLVKADDVRQAGIDFWLTRQGHGAGFWDGDWGDIGDDLTDYTNKNFPQLWPYTGDDGLIYF